MSEELMNKLLKNNSVIVGIISFRDLTFELLVHKYLFYEMDQPLISNDEYDQKLSQWRSLGESLDVDVNNIPFWKGFNNNHHLAPVVVREAKRRIGKL